MRFYVVGLAVACAALAYMLGRGVATARCDARMAASAREIQIYTIKQQEKIDVETVNTRSADIRRVLREKYTIAD